MRSFAENKEFGLSSWHIRDVNKATGTMGMHVAKARPNFGYALLWVSA